LFTLLSKYRALISVILPDHWRHEYTEPTEYYQEFQWDLETISRALEHLYTQDQIRVCLFIDGLDEYEHGHRGSHETIVKLFQHIAKSPNIKICLSSRPWLVFKDAFQMYPGLRLQDLNSTDISRYVEDKLNDHTKMKELRRTDPLNAEALMQNIVMYAAPPYLLMHMLTLECLNN
jgi:hypothetical protein